MSFIVFGEQIKIELLPFKKMCSIKYEKLGIAFPFTDKPEPTKDDIKKFEQGGYSAERLLNLVSQVHCNERLDGYDDLDD